MGNQELQMFFWDQEDFSYDIILELLQTQDRVPCIFVMAYLTFDPLLFIYPLYHYISALICLCMD